MLNRDETHMVLVPIFTWTVACAGSTQNPEAKSVERQRLGLKANGQDKFMQSLGSHVYVELSRLAKEKASQSKS